MKLKSLFYLIIPISLVILSCNDSKKEPITKTEETSVEDSTIVTLSNLSDENWENGVAKDLHIFLVDLNDKNQAILNGAKRLKLSDGTIVKVSGVEVDGNFIHINTKDKAYDFVNSAKFPNKIEVLK